MAPDRVWGPHAPHPDLLKGGTTATAQAAAEAEGSARSKEIQDQQKY